MIKTIFLILSACTVLASGTNGPGVQYIHDKIPSGPWSIHIVKAERANPDLELQTALGNGIRFGLASISDQARLFPRNYGMPVAAINGDYYVDDAPYEGDPKGIQIIRGELVSSPSDWTAFWLDANGNPQLGKLSDQLSVTLPAGTGQPLGLNEERTSKTAVLFTRAVGYSTHTKSGPELILEPENPSTDFVLRPGEKYQVRIREVRERGDTPISAGTWILSLGADFAKKNPKPQAGGLVQISTAITPDLKGARAAISGGPLLLHEGKLQVSKHSEVRHPRAAVGWNKDYVFLVEVDGRQPRLSIGMTYSEFANYLLKLGCEEALNLDGGGSATCWYNGQVMNSPSEHHQERGIGNAVVLVRKNPK